MGSVADLLLWIHTFILVPLINFWEQRVLTPWEELVTTWLRHVFHEAARIVNGTSAWFLSFFNARHRQSLKEAWQHNPWQTWVGNIQDRTTLNAVVKQHIERRQEQSNGAGPSVSPSQEGLRQRPPLAGSSQNLAASHATAATSGLDAATTAGPSRSSTAGIRRTSSMPSAGAYRSTENNRGDTVNDSKAGSRAGSASGDSGGPGNRGWWGWRGWGGHTAQQGSGIRGGSGGGSGATKPAPRVVAPLTNGVFLQHSGIGVLDTVAARVVRTTGLLEDIRLTVEERTVRAFDACRGFLRALAGQSGPGPGQHSASSQPPSPSSPTRSHSHPRRHARSPERTVVVDHRPLWEVSDGGAYHSLGGGGSARAGSGGLPGARDVSPSPSLSRASLSLHHSQSMGAAVLRTASAQLPDYTMSSHLLHSPSATDVPTSSSGLRRSVPSSSHSDTAATAAATGSDHDHTMGMSPPAGTGWRRRYGSPQSRVSVGGSAGGAGVGAVAAVGGGSGSRAAGIRRTTSFSMVEQVLVGRQNVVAGDVIRLAGYPLEVHTTTTEDGYVLCLERIPRHGSRDVVVFLHGVLDTSLSWVSAGVTGSQAFAAWDSGFDVWLANSRCNAPRLHQDPLKPATSPAYWRFSVNELGEQDISAMMRRIDEIKRIELPQEVGKNHTIAAPRLLSGVPAPSHTTTAATKPGSTRPAVRPASTSPMPPSGVSHTASRMPPAATLPVHGNSDSVLARHGSVGQPHATTAGTPSATPFSNNTSVTDATHAATFTSRPACSTGRKLSHTLATSAPMRRQSSGGGGGNGGVGGGGGDNWGGAADLSVTGSEEVYYDAVDGGAGWGGGNGDGMGGGGRGLTRAAASDGDLTLAGSTLRGAIPVRPAPNTAAPGGTAAPLASQQQDAMVAQHQPQVASSPEPPSTPHQASAPHAPLMESATSRTASGHTSSPDASRPTSPSAPTPSSRPDTPDRPLQPPHHLPPLYQAAAHGRTQQPTQAHSRAGSPDVPDFAVSNASDEGGYLLESAHSGWPLDEPPPGAGDMMAAADTVRDHNTVSPDAAGPAARHRREAGQSASASQAQWHTQSFMRRATSASQLHTQGSPTRFRPVPHPTAAWQGSDGTDGKGDNVAGSTTASASSRQPQPQLQSTNPAAVSWNQRILPVRRPSTATPSSASAATDPAAAAKPGVLVRGDDPYRLRFIAHSLGGMSLLVYLNRMAVKGQPSHVHRVILLTPAGFHTELPNVAVPLSWIFPLGLYLFRWMTWPWWRRVRGWRPALPLYIPTTKLRQLLFKLLEDLRQLPSGAELLRLAIKLLLSDDASQWDRALQMPHYSARAMPAISMDTVLHLTQSARSNHFRLFDYGSAVDNVAVYGQSVPPDVAEEYWRLGDLPVDLVAGAYDGIIPPGNVRRHYQAMKAAGLKVTYKEFEFGHLDFTFAVKDELRHYLMRLLRK